MDDLDLGATIKGFSPGQKVFGRYTLKKILGRGGMGVVWLARDEELGRDTALKFLPEVVASDRVAIDEMKREVRRAIDLAHPHIVKIHDFVTDGRTAAVSMEYVVGDTLAALRLDEPTRVFPVEKLGPWVRQLCGALDYAHGKMKVVHRDLKPANLMIDREGDLKVLDFGIAASLSESVSRVSKQAGSSGTPLYMSPQQMMGENPLVTDDIYSVGATLYELLSTKPPFYSGSIFDQVRVKVPVLLNERRKDAGLEEAPVPDEWEQTIAACLAKEAKDRPQSAGEVGARLGLAGSMATKNTTAGAVLGAEGLAKVAALNTTQAGRVVPNASSSAHPTTTEPKSKAPLIAALVGAFILLAGAGWYFGAHLPEQNRLAEVARLETKARADAEAKAKVEAEAEARAKAEADAKERVRLEAEALKLKAEQERIMAEAKAKAEQERLAAERIANARGGLVIRTAPAGAEVRVGAVALDKSPLTLKDLKLGKYPVRISAEGYEDWTGEVEVKENNFADPGVITLVRSTGTLRIASVPAGLAVTIDGTKATTPVEMKGVPTGTHEIVFQRPGWPDVRQHVNVARNETHQAQVDFSGGSVDITSTPANAEVWAKGVRLGVTPLTLQDQPPGPADFEVRHKGYATAKRTVEFAPGRKAEKWDAVLKAGGTLNGRPNFQDGPKALRAKLSINTTGAMKQSITADSTFELTGSGRDGMWNQITERVISYSTNFGPKYNYTPGTTFKYAQTLGGGWTGTTISGGWPDGKYDPAQYDRYLHPYLALVWVMPGEFWPPGEVSQGGTWPVELAGCVDFLGKVDEVKGTVTGQLKNVTDDLAVIEYTFSFRARVPAVTRFFEFKGTMRLRVNLADKYVEWGSVRYSQTDGAKMVFDTTIESEVIAITPQ